VTLEDREAAAWDALAAASIRLGFGFAALIKPAERLNSALHAFVSVRVLERNGSR
jgi:hypothetical protein